MYDVLFYRGLSKKPVEGIKSQKKCSVHCNLDTFKDITHFELRIMLNGLITSLGKYKIISGMGIVILFYPTRETP